MKVNFSYHAINRMKERGITKKEVIDTLKSPDKYELRGDTFANMKMRKNKHLLIVVFKRLVNGYKVIIVIDTSKVEKYL